VRRGGILADDTIANAVTVSGAITCAGIVGRLTVD
jgi:hypothetical protein